MSLKGTIHQFKFSTQCIILLSLLGMPLEFVLAQSLIDYLGINHES